MDWIAEKMKQKLIIDMFGNGNRYHFEEYQNGVIRFSNTRFMEYKERYGDNIEEFNLNQITSYDVNNMGNITKINGVNVEKSYNRFDGQIDQSRIEFSNSISLFFENRPFQFDFKSEQGFEARLKKALDLLIYYNNESKPKEKF
jgi:hypothetical protein